MRFSLPFDQIDGARLDAMKDEAVREGRQLDYKETLPGTNDEAKKEFLADVTSFANSAGGDLIYGVSERRDREGRPTGEIEAIVGLPNVNLDAEQLRLANIIRDGVAPRMVGAFHVIPRESRPPCLVIRVTQTWSGLHMIVYGSWSRFYARTSAGKYQLDVQQIRDAFISAATAHDRARRFRAERVAQILALETPVPTVEAPKLTLHALPVNSADEAWARFVTLSDLERLNALPIIGGTANSWQYNLDGFVVYTSQTDRMTQSYTQFFRSGGIEALSGTILRLDTSRGGFYGWGMEERVIGALTRYMQSWQTLEVTPPVMIGLTLSRVKGWRVLAGNFGWDDHAGFDRDVVMLPEVTLLDFDAPADVLLRSVFDMIWNGGGWAGSPTYKNGRWVKPR